MTYTPADYAALERAPRPVPLRASAVALVVDARQRLARGLRAVAESNRAAPAYDDYWRDLAEQTALDLDQQAHQHERVARMWAAKLQEKRQ